MLSIAVFVPEQFAVEYGGTVNTFVRMCHSMMLLELLVIVEYLVTFGAVDLLVSRDVFITENSAVERGSALCTSKRMGFIDVVFEHLFGSKDLGTKRAKNGMYGFDMRL